MTNGNDLPTTSDASTSSPSNPHLDEAARDAKVVELRASLEKFEAAKRYTEYAKVLVQLAETVSDVGEAIELLMKAADMFVVRFANQAEAIKLLERVLVLRDGYEPAVAQLRPMYEKRRDWEKLVLLERRLIEASTNDAERRARRFELAKLAMERVKKPEVCVPLWQAVAADNPQNLEALVALAQFHERAKEFGALADTLEAQVRATVDKSQRIAVLAKLALVASERLADETLSASAWRRVLNEDPADRRAVEALKKKYLQLARFGELEGLFEESQKWDELIRLLEGQEAREESIAAKVAILLATARVWTVRKEKTDRARKSLERALDLDGSHVDSATALWPIVEASNEPPAQLRVLSILREAARGEARGHLALRIGNLQEREGNGPAALEARLDALACVPVGDAPLELVLEAAFSQGAAERLLAVLEARRALEEVPGEFGLAWAATCWRAHQDPARVAPVLEAYGPESPLFARAVVLLSGIYESAGQFERLKTVLETALDRATDGGQRRELQLRLARVHDTGFQDAAGAARVLEAAIEEHGLHGALAEPLADLLARAGETQKLRQLLERQVHEAQTTETRVASRISLARLLAGAANDAPGAIAGLEIVLDSHATHVDARALLEALVLRAEVRDAAASLLIKLLTAAGDLAALSLLHRSLAADDRPAGDRKAHWLSVADLARTQGASADEEHAARIHALCIDPADDELLAVVAGFVGASAIERSAQAFGSILASLAAGSALVTTYRLALAEFEERAGRLAAAVAVLLAEVKDTHEPKAVERLESIFAHQNDGDGLEGLLALRLNLGVEPGARLAILRRLARLQEGRASRVDAAVATWHAVLDAESDAVDAFDAIERLHRQEQSWVALRAILERRCERSSVESERADLSFRLGELLAGPLADANAAVDAYEAAARGGLDEARVALDVFCTGSEAARFSARLEALFRETGDARRLLRTLRTIANATTGLEQDERLAELSRLHDADGQSKLAFDTALERLGYGYSEGAIDDAERLARRTSEGVAYLAAAGALARREPARVGALLLARLGAFALEELGDGEGALDRFRSSFELDGSNEDVARELETLLSRLARHAELADFLTTRARGVEGHDPGEASLLWTRVARLATDHLKDDRRAAQAYEKALAPGGADRPLFEAAQASFRRIGDYRALLDACRARSLTVADDERITLGLEVAATLETHMADVGAAIDAYRDVLAIRSDDAVAQGRLSALFELENRWSDLAELLEQQRLTVRGDYRPRLHCRLARVVFERLNQADRAVALYEEVLNEDADYSDALTALEQLLEVPAAAQAAARVLARIDEQAGRLESVARSLEVELRTTSEAHEQAAILARLVRLHEESLGDAPAAFAAALKLLVVADDADAALKQAQRLAGLVGGHGELVEALESLAASPGSSDEQRATWLLEGASSADSALRDDGRAIGLLRAALSIDERLAAALSHLERIYERTGQRDELAATLERHVEVAHDGNEATTLRLRFAALALGLPGRAAVAVRAAVDVLAFEPSRIEAYELLERAIGAGVGIVEAREYLVPWLENAGDGERLATALARLLRHCTDPGERVDEGVRLAKVYEVTLSDDVRALGVSLYLLRLDAADERSLELGKRLAAGVEDGWESVAQAFEEGIARVSHGDERLGLELALADVIESELGDISRAEAVYRRAHDAQPNAARPLQELDRIYDSLESWDELEKVVALRVAQADNDASRVELLLRLAKLREEHVHNADGALAAYLELVQTYDRQNTEALDGLERIYEQRGQWEALDGVLVSRLEFATSETQEARIRARIADIAADRLGDRRRAIDTWRYVLDLKGEDAEALGKLARLYQLEGDWPAVDGTLDRLADVVDGEARINVLSQRARLAAEKLQAPSQAREIWFRVLHMDPANLSALRAVVAIDEQGGHPRDLVDSILRLVEHSKSLIDAEERSAWVLRAVHILVGSLEADDEALQILGAEALSSAEGPLAEARLELLLRAGRHGDVVALERELATSCEGENRGVHLRRAMEHARTHLHDADLEADLAVALDGASSTPETQSELAKCLRAAKRWDALVELRLSQLDTASEGAERSVFLLEIGDVFEGPLADPEQAFEAFLNALSDEPTSAPAAACVERIASNSGRWPDVVGAVADWLAGPLETKARLALCLHMARWWGEVLDRPEQARPFYEEVLKLEPSSARALRQMAALERRRGNDAEVESLLRRALETVRSAQERAELLFELGGHFERVRNDANEAVIHYGRAFELDPTMAPLVDALVRIHADRGDRRQLAAVLTAKGRAIGARPDGAHALARAAEIFENDLSEISTACELYREALEAFVEHRGALDGYLRTASTFGRWDEIAVVIDARIKAAVSPRERVELLVRGADLRLEQFLDSEGAVTMLEAALELDPSEQRAYAILSRAYRHMRRFDALVGTYERHLGAATSLSDKASIYGQLGEALFEAGEFERAIDAYRNQSELDDRNLQVLEVLARLYEKTGDVVQALDTLQRLGDRLVEPKRRAEAFVKAAQILDERMGDRTGARQLYLRAIDSNPDDLQCLRWLARIAVDDGDFAAAARFFDREQSLLVEPIERSACLVRLADVRSKYLDDSQGAEFALETALELDPDSEAAAERLVDGFIQAQAWAKAQSCLNLLTRKAGHRPREEQHGLFVKLGRTCAELGADEKALRAYTSAHQLDAQDHAILLVMAGVAVKLNDPNAGLAHLQKLTTLLPTSEVELLVEAHAKMGAIYRSQAHARLAISAFEKALALEPSHRDSLRGVIELYTEAEDWRQVVAFKREELDATLDGDARYGLLLDIADVLVDKEKNVPKAIDALDEARELRPLELPLLHRLMALYQQLEDWRRVIETVERIIAAEPDPIRRSRYVYTVAQLYRDKEQDADRALQLFEEALDANPRLLEAFERVNKILTQRKDWKSLERAFRRMVKRLQTASISDADLHFKLWHNLGLIYRDRLVEPNAAIEAFKMATQYKPDEAVERQILAELYEATGQIDSAVGEHCLVLAKDPLRVDPYRSLYKLYARQGDADRTWCMSSALVFLKKADDDERRFFEANRGEGLPKIRARLDNEHWVRNVFHKDDNLFVGKVFEMIAPAAAKARMNQLVGARQVPALDSKARQDATSTVTAVTTLRWAADVLGVRAPDVYLREDEPNAFVCAGIAPPVSYVGQRVLSGASPLEMAFLAGRHMAMHRGEHVIRTLFPTYLEIKVLFFAALCIVRQDVEVDPSIEAAVKATAADLERLIETREKENLRVVVQRFLEGGQVADLKRWVQAVEFTSCRAGFLLCGDLDVARRMVLAEPTVAGDPSPQDKLREVMLFSVSDAYFGLRKTLGIALV